MSILSLNDYLAAKKQRVIINKTTTRTGVAAKATDILDIAGNPGAGTLAGTSTTAGVVPTDATAGFPAINAFSGGAAGYLTNLEAWWNVAGDLCIYDVLWKGGAYAFNANTALSAQPGYSSRIPGGTDYTGLELWCEAVTAFTGTPSFNITYTNQAGTGSRSTGAIAADSALILGRMFQMPLASGDSGIQKVDNVAGTVASAGTFNVLVMRPLARVRIPVANGFVKYNLMDLGCPQVWDTSALLVVPTPDSTATQTPWVALEVSNY